jgi:hypothetical protein
MVTPATLRRLALVVLLLFLFPTASQAAPALTPPNPQEAPRAGRRRSKKKAPKERQQTFLQPGPSASWAPPEVDAAVPPVAPDVPCSLPKVLKSTAQRVEELLANLPQFTATEQMQHQEMGADGVWRAPETVSFTYLAEMQEIRPGMLKVVETRNGSSSLNLFPAHLATLGLPGMVVVFHPWFRDDYTMTCEGLGQWQGQPAWQVHFQQRPDRPARLRAFVIQNYSFPLKLKGRAWIAADSYQVLHMETDLLEPVPPIHLRSEHLRIDYGPVSFPKRRVKLWLPESAEIFMDYRGHRYRRLHTFSDFLLFTVDTTQKITEPKEP